MKLASCEIVNIYSNIADKGERRAHMGNTIQVPSDIGGGGRLLAVHCVCMCVRVANIVTCRSTGKNETLSCR